MESAPERTTVGRVTGPATPAAPPARRLHPARVAVVVALVGVAVFLVIVIAATARTDDVTGRVSGRSETANRPGFGPESGRTRPLEVESVQPAPTDVVGPQPEIRADLLSGYDAALIVDGKEIPDDQVAKIIPLGQISFRPGKGKDIDYFDAGVHSVRVVYWPDVGTRERDGKTFDWTFRVAA